MSFFDDIGDTVSSWFEDSPDVSTEYVSGLTDALPEVSSEYVSGLINYSPDIDLSGLTDSVDLSYLSDAGNDVDFSSLLDYVPTDTSYGMDNFLNAGASGYDTAGMDRLLSDLSSEPASIGTTDLSSFNPSELYSAQSDVSQYLAPGSELAQITDPVQQLERLQSAGVYGMSPDTGTSYSIPELSQTQTVSSVAPAYMGPGSDSFNEYYDPKTGVVPTNAGIPLSSASWLTKLMGRSGQGRKSNLASGIGAALMAAQIAGALRGNKGADDEADNITTAGQAKSAIKQTPTKAMTWVTPTNKAAGGPIRGDAGRPQGALGLLRGMRPGQEDGVPIKASHGEYVFDADVVAALGDGNTEAGAAKLDSMRQRIRQHKRAAPPSKIPPKAKTPEAYLKGRR